MRTCWGGRGRGILIPYPCKSKRRSLLSLNVVRALLLKVRGEHAGGGAGGKTCPFLRTFCEKEKKKMFATNFFSYIHVKNKEGITVAEKIQ